MHDYELFRDQCSSWHNVNPASNYARPAPNIFNLVSDNVSLKLWFLRNISKAHQEVPPQDLYLFNNVYVHDIAILFSDDGVLINGSERDNRPVQKIEEISNRDDFEFFPGLSAFIFKAGKDNYGHLLIEMLPKLEILDKECSGKVNLLVPSMDDRLLNIIEQVNREIYGNKFIIKRLKTPFVKCEELLYPGPITKHNDQKSEIVNIFMEKLIAKYKGGSLNKDIYISRRNFHNRRWVNEMEAEEIFSQRGFEIIFPEKLSFQDQVNIFSSCNNIAGALGAGLSNICFSPRNTKIVMIDNGMYDFFFYDLSCIREQEFSWIFTKKIALENVTLLHEDWAADSSFISTALTML